MSTGGIRAFTFTPEDGVPPAVAPFSHATAAGPTLYVTGQMPTDVTGTVVGHGVAAQTDKVVRNLLRVTELCGGGLADVVAVRASVGAAVYRTDVDGQVTIDTEGVSVRVRTYVGEKK